MLNCWILTYRPLLNNNSILVSLYRNKTRRGLNGGSGKPHFLTDKVVGLHTYTLIILFGRVFWAFPLRGRAIRSNKFAPLILAPIPNASSRNWVTVGTQVQLWENFFSQTNINYIQR